MIAIGQDKEAVASALQLAVRRGEIELVYQPKLSLPKGAVTGVEALARWRHESFGQVDPALFIPIAEEIGIIDDLTERVCKAALAQCRSWNEQGIALNVAVNISALSLRDVDFPDHLQRLCQLEGVDCEQLTVELTEGATQHAVRLLDTLTRFRLKGMSVSIDDFGTGYSSLLQLRQLPFTELKIDQYFVRDVATAEDSREIVRSVIDLAHALGLTAVAEGVEDEETLAVLRRLGGDYAQGFFIARPMRGAELVPWILANGAKLQSLCGLEGGD